MKMIRIKNGDTIPKNFTGRVEYKEGTRKWLAHIDIFNRKEIATHKIPDRIRPTIMVEWYIDGKLERVDDLPTQIWSDGTMVWMKHNKAQRTDGPAIIEGDGRRHWIKNEKTVLIEPPTPLEYYKKSKK